MFSGVRGLYVDIKKEIPEALIFCGRKGRIYFEGMKPKCYVCKSETHIKMVISSSIALKMLKNNQHMHCNNRAMADISPTVPSALKKACPKIRSQPSEVVDKRQGEQQPAPTIETKSVNDGDARKDGAATTGEANVGTRKRQNKGEKIAKRTDKRQLSINSSDSNNQPQEKKKAETVDESNDGSIITVDDDMQSNRSYIGEPEVQQESESESDLEVLDFKVATTEAIKAWNDKRERMSRRQAKKIELLLSKHK